MSALDDINQDFERDVWCLLGLPIDNLTLDDVLAKFYEHRVTDTPKVLSTINLNWIVTSLKDGDFRKSIIDSDICTIDGVPLLWLANFFHLPIREVVTGSGLIESLFQATCREEDKRTIYFFGGDEGAGKAAMNRVNDGSEGLRAVGWHNPGFGLIEDINAEAYLTSINAKSPDLLLVALGAKRGQAWIALNKSILNARIISHLGAAINFIGGAVKRAPRWMQKAGLEWVWRICQEPKLFGRYFSDALLMVRVGVSKAPLFIRYRKRYDVANRVKTTRHFSIEKVELDGFHRVVISGESDSSNIELVRQAFKQVALNKIDVELCFAGVIFIDNQFLGVLLLLIKHQSIAGKKIQITGVTQDIDQILRANFLCHSLTAMGFDIWHVES